jgi:hypothetical protein
MKLSPERDRRLTFEQVGTFAIPSNRMFFDLLETKIRNLVCKTAEVLFLLVVT